MDHNTALEKIKSLLDRVLPEHLEDSLTADAEDGLKDNSTGEVAMNEYQPIQSNNEKLCLSKKKVVIATKNRGLTSPQETPPSFTLPDKVSTKGRPMEKEYKKKTSIIERVNSQNPPTKRSMAKWHSNSCFIDCVIEVIQRVVLTEVSTDDLKTTSQDSFLIIRSTDRNARTWTPW